MTIGPFTLSIRRVPPMPPHVTIPSRVYQLVLHLSARLSLQFVIVHFDHDGEGAC